MFAYLKFCLNLPPKPSKTWPEKRIVFYDPLKIDSKKIVFCHLWADLHSWQTVFWRWKSIFELRKQFSRTQKCVSDARKQFSAAENWFSLSANCFLRAKIELGIPANCFPSLKMEIWTKKTVFWGRKLRWNPWQTVFRECEDDLNSTNFIFWLT